MTKPTSLREPSTDECRKHGSFYHYWYQALGFMSGRTHENVSYDDVKWDYAHQWCEYYASYMIRAMIHDITPVGMSLAWQAFEAFELPNLKNLATDLACEADNG